MRNQIILAMSLLSINSYAVSGACPNDTVTVGSWCVDKFEGSVNEQSDCTGRWINADKDTLSEEKNGIKKSGEISGEGAFACSVSGVKPARWITWFQAATLCAKAGKQIIPDSVWVTAAIGTDKSKCTTDSPDAQMPNISCKSQWGAFDMVGNVWEWTDAWVVSGRTSLEKNGKPFDVASSKDGVWPAEYCDPKGVKCMDTVWGVNGEAGSGHEMVEGLPAATLRGGNFKMKEAAGVYAMTVNPAPSHFRETSGFRCAQPK